MKHLVDFIILSHCGGTVKCAIYLIELHVITGVTQPKLLFQLSIHVMIK